MAKWERDGSNVSRHEKGALSLVFNGVVHLSWWTGLGFAAPFVVLFFPFSLLTSFFLSSR